MLQAEGMIGAKVLRTEQTEQVPKYEEGRGFPVQKLPLNFTDIRKEWILSFKKRPSSTTTSILFTLDSASSTLRITRYSAQTTLH